MQKFDLKCNLRPDLRIIGFPAKGTIFIRFWHLILFFDNYLLTNDKFGAILYVFNRLKADELKYVKDKEG